MIDIVEMTKTIIQARCQVKRATRNGCDNLFIIPGHLTFMCATCGCGIDLGGIEDVFAKDYSCGDCGLSFKGFGYKVTCPRCMSANTKRMK